MVQVMMPSSKQAPIHIILMGARQVFMKTKFFLICASPKYRNNLEFETRSSISIYFSELKTSFF
jgi:hypothetical protein